MVAVSTISTMKVERPRARSSAAPTRLNSRSMTPMRASRRRHEASDLRHDGDQRVLAQERRLAGHVGAGDEPHARRSRLPRARQVAVIGDEGRRRRASKRILHHRVTARADAEVRPRRRPRDACSRLARQARPAPQRHRAAPAPAALRRSLGGIDGTSATQLIEDLELERQRPRGGPAMRLSVGQFVGGEAHGIGHRLAMDGRWRLVAGPQRGVAVGCGRPR